MNLLGSYVNATIVDQIYATQGIVTALHPHGTMTLETPDGSVYTCDQAGATPVRRISNPTLLAWIDQKRKDLGL